MHTEIYADINNLDLDLESQMFCEIKATYNEQIDCIRPASEKANIPKYQCHIPLQRKDIPVQHRVKVFPILNWVACRSLRKMNFY